MNTQVENGERIESPPWLGYLVVAIIEVVLTLGLRLLQPILPLADFPIPYILVMMLIAFRFGKGPTIFAFVLGFVCFAYFFPPHHGIWPLAITPTGWAGLVALLIGTGIVGFASVSIRKSMNRAESLATELRRANQHTIDTLERIAECYFRMDLECRFLEVNRIAEETVFKRPASDLLGKSHEEEYSSFDSEFQRQCKRAVAEMREAHFEAQIEPTGRWFECYVFPQETYLDVYMHDIHDRKQAEESLRKSEQKYRLLIETMDEGFATADEDYVFTYVNLRFTQMLGYAQDEMLGHGIQEFLDKANWALMQEQIAQRRKGVYGHYELSWVAKDGQAVYTIISPRPIVDDDGRFIGSFATVTDITDRKRSEEALRESEHKYRELFHNANDAIFLLEVMEDGSPGHFMDVNDIACRRLGYSREELLNMGPKDIDGPDAGKHLPAIMKEMLEKGTGTFKMVQLSRSGARIPVEISSHLLELSGKRVILSIARDITERKLSEERLRKSEERFRALCERAADGLFLHDLEGRFVEVNKAACETLGYTREELLGMSVADIVTTYSQADLDELWKELLAKGPMTVYMEHRRKDGSTLDVEGRLSPFDYHDQALVLEVVRDITERKRTEEEQRAFEMRIEEQKRVFYKETILSVTDGKLDICDECELAPYLTNAELMVDVSNAAQLSVARCEVEEFCHTHGLDGDLLDLFTIAVGEAMTNAVKHGTKGRVYAGVKGDYVWVGIQDEGPGIGSLILPRAVLLRGFSTKPSLGLGYSVMLDVADQIHLKTDEHGTIVILEKRIREQDETLLLQNFPDTWNNIPG
ncbi:MAG: PAS domain S-box protein [Armatimonadetes bacterium]|nr:PAS domain S-box protein [Armatimonadota bacterium]